MDAKIRNFHWHDLRHCFVVRSRAGKVRPVDIADALGNETPNKSGRCVQLGEEGLHDVVVLLERQVTDQITDTRTNRRVPAALACRQSTASALNNLGA
jgi:hypothetical protein